MSVEAILKQAEELTLEERATLLHRLEQGMLDAGWQPEVELTDDVKAMLDERDADFEANPDAGYTWEEVVAFVKRKK